MSAVGPVERPESVEQRELPDGVDGRLSRRRFMALSSGAVAAVVAGTTAASLPAGAAPAAVPAGTAGNPVDRAYRYLDTVMDGYQQGAAPRLLQSYNNESGLMTTAFVYDSALALIAYLARPTREHERRARVIGDTFLWIQGNDERFSDGRIRQAYAAGPMLFYDGSTEFTGVRRDDGHAAFLWPFGFSGTATGDAAWVSLALATLYGHTRERRYLDGAVALGDWIATTTPSPYKYGGYLGGVQGDGVTNQRWASTEHNIDVYALYRLLGRYTGQKSWYARAEVAHGFLRGMWNPAGGHFWTGTIGGNPTEDPNEINPSPVPEDVNTWSWLALAERRYARSVDWVAATLATTDGGPASQVPDGLTISGVIFSDVSKTLSGIVPNGSRPNDRSAVWLEGTAHLAAALADRGGPHDRKRAAGYLRQIAVAQQALGGGQTVGRTSDPMGGRLSDPAAGGTWPGSALPAASGIVAATSAFDTGFGFGYFQNQHLGATSWFILASLGVNPFDPRC